MWRDAAAYVTYCVSQKVESMAKLNDEDTARIAAEAFANQIVVGGETLSGAEIHRAATANARRALVVAGVRAAAEWLDNVKAERCAECGSEDLDSAVADMLAALERGEL